MCTQLTSADAAFASELLHSLRGAQQDVTPELERLAAVRLFVALRRAPGR